MKALSGLLLLILALTSNAGQAQKIAHLNLQDLVLQLPETKKADSLFNSYKKALLVKDSVMTVHYRLVLAQASSMKNAPDSILKVKENELANLQNQIQAYENGARDSLEKKRQSLYTPISNKVIDVVKQVAKEEGYVYVFDMSAGAVIYAS